jgi:hypothetical protein
LPRENPGKSKIGGETRPRKLLRKKFREKLDKYQEISYKEKTIFSPGGQR